MKNTMMINTHHHFSSINKCEQKFLTYKNVENIFCILSSAQYNVRNERTEKKKYATNKISFLFIYYSFRSHEKLWKSFQLGVLLQLKQKQKLYYDEKKYFKTIFTKRNKNEWHNRSKITFVHIFPFNKPCIA